MERKGQCGVYILYKLSKGVGNTFNFDFKKEERGLHVVTHDYADLINEYSTINGSFYEYNEKASELYWQNKPYGNGADAVVDKKEKDIVLDSGLEDLKSEYLELAGKPAHHFWKEAKIKEEIEKLKK